MRSISTVHTWRPLPPVPYYFAIIILARLLVRHYGGNQSPGIDIHGPSKFPVEMQGATSGGMVPDGGWKMQVNFTVIDTFPGHSYSPEQEESAQKASDWKKNLWSESQQIVAQAKGRIRVQADAICPVDPVSNALCLSVIPELSAAFGPALENIEEFLYTAYPRPGMGDTQDLKNYFTASVPHVQSITVTIRHFNAEEKLMMLAYVARGEVDETSRSMNIDLDYLTQGPRDVLRFQVQGLVQHELVHCFQHFKPHPKAQWPPKGLVEGIADFVTLKAGVLDTSRKAPRPLSSRARARHWDIGYAETAYFLEWLEDVRVGRGAIGRLNDRLYRIGYHSEGQGMDDETGNEFWKSLFGATVEELWEEYGEWLDKTNRWGHVWFWSMADSCIATLDAIIDYIDPRLAGALFGFFLGSLVILAFELFSRASGVDDPLREEPNQRDDDDEPVSSQSWLRWLWNPTPRLLSQSASPPVYTTTIIDDEGVEWEVEAVLDSRTYYGKLQYRVRWAGEGNDPGWYYASLFKNGPQMIQNFHKLNPSLPGPSVRLDKWLEAAEAGETLEDHRDDNKPASKRGRRSLGGSQG